MRFFSIPLFRSPFEAAVLNPVEGSGNQKSHVIVRLAHHGHKDELAANWELAVSWQHPYKNDPLR